tara:strand:- start:656 stop:994 length:339 start_codon:yes stop_codon:yes gene_type:complete
MATKADIRDRVLRKLNVLGEGQTADAGDAAIVENSIDEMHEWMIVKDYAYWGDAIGDIPLEALPFFVLVVGAETAGDFGVQAEIGLAQLAVSELRKLGEQDISGEPVETDYF